MENQPSPTPVIPPDWFVARVNANSLGGRFRTALDPLVMELWAIATREPERSQLTIVTGI